MNGRKIKTQMPATEIIPLLPTFLIHNTWEYSSFQHQYQYTAPYNHNICTVFLSWLVQKVASVPKTVLSGDLHYCGKATPSVCRHRTTLCTQDKDKAGDEEFRGRRSSYLEQSTWHPANCNFLPLDVCWTSEGSPVWFTEGARLRTIYDALYKSTHHHHHHHHQYLQLPIFFVIWCLTSL